MANVINAALVSDLERAEIEYCECVYVVSMQLLCVRFALYKYTCAVRSRFLPTLCTIRATSKRVDRGATTPRPTTPGVARNARLVVSLATNTPGTVKQRRYTLYQNLLRHRHCLRSYGFLEKRREYYPRIFYLHRLPFFHCYYVRNEQTYVLYTYVLARVYVLRI